MGVSDAAGRPGAGAGWARPRRGPAGELGPVRWRPPSVSACPPLSASISACPLSVAACAPTPRLCRRVSRVCPPAPALVPAAAAASSSPHPLSLARPQGVRACVRAGVRVCVRLCVCARAHAGQVANLLEPADVRDVTWTVDHDPRFLPEFPGWFMDP